MYWLHAGRPKEGHDSVNVQHTAGIFTTILWVLFTSVEEFNSLNLGLDHSTAAHLISDD